ncbi:MAG: tetratricopeptide repeat protein, partial [Myxococcales bacterium]|nr:tetratricopeptide repeat protein [Myxococcales bacterium]
FCVSLWEALCGIRPDRRERGKHGLVPLPDGARMAKRLHRALSRGLALESDQRYPDMPTLLADLEPPQRKWLVPAAAAASTAVLATAVGFALVPATPAITEDPCALATAPIDALWTEDRAKAVTEQLEGSLGSRAAAGVSEWAQSWAKTADQSCREVHVHHRHSEASLDRQSRCLDRALQGFTGLLETVEQQQLGSMAELHTWLGSLDQPQDCLGEVAGQVDYDPVPDGNRDEAIELRRAALQQLASEDPLQQRISATEQLLARAREIGWKPLIIDISLALARLHQAGHHVDQARTVLGQVIDLGTAAGDLERVADAWLLLQEIHLRSTFEMTEAQWAWQRAAGLFAEVSPSKRRKARLSMGHGSIQLQLGKLAEAEKDLRAAISIYTGIGDSVAMEHAVSRRLLAMALSDAGQAEAALIEIEHARELESAASPSDLMQGHTEVTALLREGGMQNDSGNFETALTLLDRGLSLAERQLGADSEQALRYHILLASVYENLGRQDDFRRETTRADEISRIAVSPRSLLRAEVLSAVGALALQDEQLQVARGAFAEALTITKNLLPADGIDVALAERNLAVALHALGRDNEARALLEHCLIVLEQEYEPDHDQLAYPLKTLGSILIARGEVETGETMLLRSRSILSKSFPDSQLINDIDALLARPD